MPSRRLRVFLALCALCAPLCAQDPAPPKIERPERVVLVGHQHAETVHEAGYFEAALRLALPGKPVVVRTLGWPGDEVALHPRPLNYGTREEHLERLRATAILLFFGANECWRGAPGLAAFRADLDELLSRWGQTRFDGIAPPRLVLVGPLPHAASRAGREFAALHNRDVALYSEAMKQLARRHGIAFVDLANLPVVERTKMGLADGRLRDGGNMALARRLVRALGHEPLAAAHAGRSRLIELARRKHRLWFFRYRAVNGEYIYGRRKEPFGVHNFPEEMKRLQERVAALDRQMQEISR